MLVRILLPKVNPTIVGRLIRGDGLVLGRFVPEPWPTTPFGSQKAKHQVQGSCGSGGGLMKNLLVKGRPRRGKTHCCGPAPVQSLHPGRATSARQNDHPAGDRGCHGRLDGSARPGPPAVAVAEWQWARSAHRLLWRLPGVETGPAGSTAPRLRCRGLSWTDLS